MAAPIHSQMPDDKVAQDLFERFEIIARLWTEACAGVPEAKADALLRKWVTDPQAARWHAMEDPEAWVSEAVGFATAVLLFQQPLTGASGIQRFSARYHAPDQRHASALDALRKARFRIVDLHPRAHPERLTARDVSTGEVVVFLNHEAGADAAGQRVAGRFCALAHGHHAVIGPLLPLEAPEQTVVDGYWRKDRGLINPERCAAALYSHAVRNGVRRIAGLNNLRPLPAAEPEEMVFANDVDVLSALANEWADVDGSVEPSEEQMLRVRNNVSAAAVVNCLLRAVVTRRAKVFRLADAYSRILLVQIETLYLRGKLGVGGATIRLDEVAKTVDLGIADGSLPREVHDLFADLCTRVRLQAGDKPTEKTDGDELGRVLQRIRALREKTIERGCSEQEALAAADKVAELLERYGLSLSEIELRRQSCESVGVDTGRKRRGAIDECVPTVAHFCDCHVWSETSPAGSIRYVFFGLPADVEAAHYLYELIVVTIETETAAFKESALYFGTPTRERRKSVSSYQTGFAFGLRAKMDRLKAARSAANLASSGRDLVPVKTSVIEEELKRLGLSFYKKASRRGRSVHAGAYEAGQMAGQKFEPHRGLDSAGE